MEQVSKDGESCVFSQCFSLQILLLFPRAPNPRQTHAREVGGRRSPVGGRRSTVDGRRSPVGGRRSPVDGRRSTGSF